MHIAITPTQRSRLQKVDFDHLIFGEIFSDHMLDVVYENGVWGMPRIVPFGPFEVSPALAVFHYGQAVFEGLKAFRGVDGQIHLFRPDKNHARLNQSCRRLGIPEVSRELFMDGLVELVKLDQAWIPSKRGTSLYIRPFIIAAEDFLGVRVAEKYRLMIITSPVGAFYKEGFNPVRLMTSGDYVRAVRGGLGAAKTPANYAASLLPAHEAKQKGFSQVLWLDAIERRYIEEVGTMNLFLLIGNGLITPPLDGTILGGVTRDCVLHLARSWGMPVAERRVTIDEVLAASVSGQLKEIFGAGTAAVISPVGMIEHQEEQIIINNGQTGPLAQKLYAEITGIQYGEKADPFGWRYTL